MEEVWLVELVRDVKTGVEQYCLLLPAGFSRDMAFHEALFQYDRQFGGVPISIKVQRIPYLGE